MNYCALDNSWLLCLNGIWNVHNRIGFVKKCNPVGGNSICSIIFTLRFVNKECIVFEIQIRCEFIRYLFVVICFQLFDYKKIMCNFLWFSVLSGKSQLKNEQKTRNRPNRYSTIVEYDFWVVNSAVQKSMLVVRNQRNYNQPYNVINPNFRVHDPNFNEACPFGHLLWMTGPKQALTLVNVE